MWVKRSRGDGSQFYYTASNLLPAWWVQIEKRADEAHAEIRAAGMAARRSIGQFLRYRREGSR